MWKAPHAIAARPSSTSGRRQSTARAISAPYCTARSGTPLMSGSSYCPMSAVYVHGMAPFARIQATATDVSRPPENAIPTRSPAGREVRTLLTSRRLHQVLCSRLRALRQGDEMADQIVTTGRIAADDQDGVISGDRAEYLGQAGAVQRARQEVGRTGRGSQHDKVGAGLRAHHQLGEQAGQPRWWVVGGTAHGEQGAVLGDDVDGEAAVGRAELHRAELVQIPREGGLGDLNTAGAKCLGQLHVRMDGAFGQQRDDA